MAKQLKVNHLTELIHYIISIGKYEALKEYMEHQSRARNGIIKPLENSLWEHICLYINTKKEKKHLSETIITQTVLSKSRIKRRVEVLENLIKTIKQFLIHQYLEEDDLLREWIYWKSLKNTSITESQEQLEVVKNKLNIRQLSKTSSLHQYLAFDFYEESYQIDCLESSTPSIDNLRNSQYALHLLNSQNQSEIDIESHNRKTILREEVPKNLSFEEDINYAALINEIPHLSKDITGEDFILKHEKVLMDASISNDKKKLLLGFLINKSYRLFVDNGNQAPLMSFWKIYFDFGIRKKMFYNANYLNLQHYLNTLSILFFLDKTQLLSFIDKYESDLAPNDFPIGKQLRRAFVEYNYNKNYLNVIQILSEQINYGRRVELMMWYHTLKIRAAYEIYAQTNFKDKSNFNRLCESFISYLKNKKKHLNRVRERNEKFVYWIRLIAKQRSTVELEQYKFEIGQKDIIYSTWLLEKIDKKIEQM